MDEYTLESTELQRESIRTNYLRSVAMFKDLLEMIRSSQASVSIQIPYKDVEEQLGRFRLWGETYGAHRYERASLDHKLRLATNIRDEMVAELEGLYRTLVEG